MDQYNRETPVRGGSAGERLVKSTEFPAEPGMRIKCEPPVFHCAATFYPSAENFRIVVGMGYGRSSSRGKQGKADPNGGRSCHMKVMVSVKASPRLVRCRHASCPQPWDITTSSWSKPAFCSPAPGYPSSKQVRFSGKERAVIDGPFTRGQELIADYWRWKVKSMQKVVDRRERPPIRMRRRPQSRSARSWSSQQQCVVAAAENNKKA
jgi:hypothetical protein